MGRYQQLFDSVKVCANIRKYMKKFLLALAATLATLVVALPAAAPPYLPIDQVKPGMVGTGLTVWQGNKVEEFKVNILGVLRNVIGPQRDLILARLEGGPLAQTGVIAGMSGSPVYIDGRLVGAVSYSLGAFSKEPLAGITPINEMIDAATLDTPRAPLGMQARLEVPITNETVAAAMRASFSWVRPFADRPGDVEILSPASSGLNSQMATMLRPISTPLVMAGFGADAADLLSTAFRESGFMAMAGAAADPAADASMNGPGPLKPGDPIGVNLVSGDFEMGATGTVTEVVGSRVYAFGHPFYSLGPIQFPMTRAYVHALLPSLTASMKIATTGALIGTVSQDRATTIAGTLGAGPQMIPVKMTLQSDRGFKKSFAFQVVNDQVFTPLFTYASILSTLGSYERETGAASFSIKGRISVKSHSDIQFDDLFTGDRAAVNASASLMAPLAFLIGNDFEPVDIQGVELTIDSTEHPRTATIERVWLDGVHAKAGRTLPLKVLMRNYRGEEVVRTVPLEIPANAAGTLQVMVSDGSRLAQWERREVRQPSEPRSVPQMIRALNTARRNNRLYVRLLAADAGAVVSGQPLSALPPSVLSVLESDRSAGEFVPLRSATLGEWDLPMEYAVVGSRTLSITLDAN
jgi:SpoIVB peptidase S55